MINKIQDGASFDMIVSGSAIASGAVVQAGDLIGVAQAGGAVGDNISVTFKGVFSLPKTAGVGTGVAQGTKVYWDNTAHAITNTASTNKVAGYMWALSADADVTAQVRLLG